VTTTSWNGWKIARGGGHAARHPATRCRTSSGTSVGRYALMLRRNAESVPGSPWRSLYQGGRRFVARDKESLAGGSGTNGGLARGSDVRTRRGQPVGLPTRARPAGLWSAIMPWRDRSRWQADGLARLVLTSDLGQPPFVPPTPARIPCHVRQNAGLPDIESAMDFQELIRIRRSIKGRTARLRCPKMSCTVCWMPAAWPPPRAISSRSSLWLSLTPRCAPSSRPRIVTTGSGGRR